MSSENQIWVFAARWTIENHPLEEDECRQNLKDKLKLYCSKWIFQLENTTDNLHYQIYMRVKEKIRAKTLAVRLNEELRGIEIRPCSTAGKEALSHYCMKDDTRVAGPWADRPIYFGADLPTVLYEWQRKLRDYILGPVNNREVICIVDTQGNGGKSQFMKYMMYHHGILGMCFGKAGDLKNLVYKNKPARGYIFNLTRSQPKEAAITDIWSAVEEIKDGYVVNTKFETGTVMMDPPHVVVMMNFWPKRDNMSEDRWNCIDIGQDADLRFHRAARAEQARFSL